MTGTEKAEELLRSDEPVDWHIRESRVALLLPTGETIYPTAHEIIGAEFRDERIIRGHALGRGPSDALPLLHFGRFPLEIRVRVSPPSDDLGVPASCTLQIGSGPLRVRGELTPEVDQVLIDREWRPVAVDTWDDVVELLRTVGVTALGFLTLKQYLAIRQQDTPLILLEPVAAPAHEQAPASAQSAAPPAGLCATLYPYQIVGLQWLARVADEGLGCLLADEMGLGKTLQVIALLLKETPLRRPSLVVAPATLMENWRRELARFAPSLAVVIHRGHERTGFPRELVTFDVVITSYETAVRDAGLLGSVGWNVVVLDEAQAIKNPGAQRTIEMKRLPRRVGIAVSGTPVENSLRDLWSLMDFAVPGVLGALKDFERRFEDNVHDAEHLEPLVTPLILRRRIADVATDLPERIDIPQGIELSAQGAQRYERLRATIAAQYGAAATLVSLTKLRMFCAHPFLIDGTAGDPALESTKFVRLLEILEEIFARGEKVLVFSSYTGMADILLSEVRGRYGVPVSVIDGRTPVTERQPIVDQFAAVASAAALVLNPKAAGTGLNIAVANHVIHYNLEWNPAVEDQATARSYRRGQTLPVTVHRLFHTRTVEDVIDQRLQRKRAVAATALVGTAGDSDDLADVMKALQLSPVLNRAIDAD